MDCPSCGSAIRVRKSLHKGRPGRPDECPECGEDISDIGKSEFMLIK